MRVVVDGRAYEGAAIDVSTDASATALYRAVRGHDVARISVSCPSPTPAHEYVGLLPVRGAFDCRGALAAAARTNGHEASQRPAIEEARARLRELAVPDVDVADARKRVASAGESGARIRERVATLRGRVQTLRETGQTADVAAAETDLESAIRRLSEVQTERIAAERALERAEREARTARDVADRRLRLEDTIANLEREARAELAATVYDQFVTAVSALPGPGDAGDVPGAYEGPPTTAAMAVARIADLAAPVVLDGGVFPDAESAARRLDGPVVRL